MLNRIALVAAVSLAASFTPGAAGAQVRAYTVNIGSDSVSVIDVQTNMVVATVFVGHVPVGVAASPSGAFVYVVNGTSGDVSVIDAASNIVVNTIDVDGGPTNVARTPDGMLALVTTKAEALRLFDDTSRFKDPKRRGYVRARLEGKLDDLKG